MGHCFDDGLESGFRKIELTEPNLEILSLLVPHHGQYFQTWTSTQRSASNMRVEYAGLDLAIPFDLNKQPIVTGLRKAIRK